MKKISAKEARILAKKLNIDISGDGLTFYAATDDETEIYSFDSKKERDAFLKKLEKSLCAKPLKKISGFDDVGIGVIWCGEGKGDYILCSELKGYDLTEIQIYRYNNWFRTMKAVDELGIDTEQYAYCVKREDLM